MFDLCEMILSGSEEVDVLLEFILQKIELAKRCVKVFYVST